MKLNNTEATQGAVLFPGSFDPFTIGHADLVRRALSLFPRVVVAVGYNEQKSGWIPVAERVDALRQFYRDEPRVKVVSYTGLTVDLAREMGIRCILRGVRSTKDYEYELDIADINHRLSGIETIVLFADPHLASLSSSVVRELAHFGREITEWLPKGLNYKL